MNVELEIIQHNYIGPGGYPGKLPYMGSICWPWRHIHFSCNAYCMYVDATFFCEKCNKYGSKEVRFERPIPGKDFAMKRIIFGCMGCEEPQFGFSGFNDSLWTLWGRKE